MPNISQQDGAARIEGQPLIEGLRVDHGPITLLGRFFLLADGLLEKAGVRLVRTTLREAATAQASNTASWALFPPMLDARLSHIPDDMSYGLLGLNEQGDVVCAQGGRIYDIGSRSFSDIVADQSFFYGSEIPPKPGSPVAEVTAPSARHITGRFAYSGALWVHPDYRGRHLAGLLPRLSRCFALAKWNTQFTVGMVSENNVAPRLLASYGYKKIEPRFTITNLTPDPMSWSILWMDRDELIDDLASFLDGHRAQVDAAVRDGGTQDEGRLTANRNG
jgi:hypothetical protein